MKNKTLVLVQAMLMMLAITPIFSQNYNMQFRSKLAFPGQELANICGYWQNGNEYALVGGSQGLIIVDVTNPDQPKQIVQIPGPNNRWKEIKTLGHYCYVTSEGGQGVQVIDLSPLPSATLPSKFYKGDGAIAGQLDRIHALHIDTSAAYLYAFGSGLFQGGAVVLDLQDPFNPVYAGKFDAMGYIHDGYVDNDTLYAAHIYTGTLSIVDMRDKANPKVLGTVQTPGKFTHNAWLTADRKHILTTDEKTPSFVTSFDIQDPTDIKELDRVATGDGTTSIGHNTHVINDYTVTSWYTDGFTIVDAKRPGNLVEVARYDTWAPAFTGDFFQGCWGVYPYLPSGNIIASNISPAELYVVTPTYARAAYLEGIVKDAATGNPIAGALMELTTLGKKENTISDGTFKTGYHQAGTFSVTVSKFGYLPKTVSVNLAVGQVTALEVRLSQAASTNLAGVVVEDVAGNPPVENARLHITATGVDSTVITNANGNFNLNLPAGSYKVVAYAWGYRPMQVTVTGGTPITLKLVKDVYYDDFELDYGWLSFGGATTGFWERGEPIGTTNGGLPYNPDADNPTDSGDFCYVTGNGGGGAGDDDVDGGSVTLISPPMKLANLENAVLTFDYWFANGGGSGTPNDTFSVKVTNGLEEVTILEHTQPKGQWRQSGNIELRGYLNLTDDVQIIFTTADTPGGHLVEAAIDAFKVVPGKLISVKSDVVRSALLRAYPNPSSNHFAVSYEWPDASGDLTLDIRNAQGQLVVAQPLSNTKGIYSAGDNWLPGVYFATLRNADGRQGMPVKLVRQ